MSPKKGYEVGYGRTPKHTRFRKGQSGNPKGRPKGRRNFRTEVEAMLEAPVPIRENGKVRHVATYVAALLRLREKALNGDHKALTTILQLAEQASERPAMTESNTGISASDQAIINDFLARATGAVPTTADDNQDEEDTDE